MHNMTAEIGRILLETSAKQVGAKIERRAEGHRTTVDVTMLVEAPQESEN